MEVGVSGGLCVIWGRGGGMQREAEKATNRRLSSKLPRDNHIEITERRD